MLPPSVPAVADRRVRDMRSRLREQRKVRRNVRGALDLGVRGERSDVNPVLGDPDTGQLRVCG